MLFVSASSTNIVHGHSLETGMPEMSEKKYQNINIDDDFSDDTIIVVLSKMESVKFKEYSSDDFPELDILNIEELNKKTTKIIKNQLGGQVKNTNYNETNRLDYELFRRIFAITLKYKSKINVLKAIRILEKRNEIYAVSPNYAIKNRGLPNDQSFTDSNFIAANGTQWGLNGSVWNISASNAWDISRGSKNVIVGVIDTGIRGTHQDFIDVIDSDLSRDFSKPNPIGHPLTDSSGHGTQVSGIIAAKGNNGVGISGVAWNTRIVQLKIDFSNYNAAAQLINAIDYATATYEGDNPITILNFSGGYKDEIIGVRQAILNYPGLFITAAANKNVDHDVKLDYPTNYSRDLEFVNGRNNVISVSAINEAGNRTDGVAWGETSVSIFAPGDDILTTNRMNDSSYIRNKGTSLATPHVTGVASLVTSIDPSLTPSEIKTIIIDNADLVTITHPSGFLGMVPKTIWVRRLNAETALLAIAKFKTEDISDTTIKITDVINRLNGVENISSFQIGRIVTQIGNSAFSGQSQLTQITIPSTVTHIGSDAFKNTNNAPIYLEGRTSVPSMFNVNWNVSGNPVYLNGNLCTHPSTTLTKSNHTQHGQLCDDCRTFVSKTNHNHTHSYIPYGTAPPGIAVHLSVCKCDDSVITPCVSRFPSEPGDTVMCWYCGQIFSNPIMYKITLTNGEVFVSNVPFTFEMYKALSSDLGLVYSYNAYLLESVQSQMKYLKIDDEMAKLSN